MVMMMMMLDLYDQHICIHKVYMGNIFCAAFHDSIYLLNYVYTPSYFEKIGKIKITKFQMGPTHFVV